MKPLFLILVKMSSFIRGEMITKNMFLRCVNHELQEQEQSGSPQFSKNSPESSMLSVDGRLSGSFKGTYPY